MLKISVITVCYNSEKTIEATLRSIYSQTYTAIEHIIIDGNSTDNTLNIVNKYKDKISKIISENDTGIYNAMNKGLRLATGDIVHFLNSDDRYYDEFVLEEVANEFTQSSEIKFLYGKAYPENLPDINVHRFQDTFIGQINNNIDLIHNHLNHQRIFVKRDLFKIFGNFNEYYKICADHDWIMKYFFSGETMQFFNRYVVIYNAQGASYTQLKTLIQEKVQIILNNGSIIYLFRYFIYAVFRNIFKTRSKNIEN